MQRDAQKVTGAGRLSAMADDLPAPGAHHAHPGRLTRFEHDGLHFDVRDEGPLEGDVVVLLHGFPQRAASWSGVATRLHRAGLRTLAPDQRGYSPGARPRRRRDYRIDRLCADIEVLLDRLRDRGVAGVHLVGHDWGSAVAWLVAARHPMVRTLTSVSVPHPAAYLRATLSRDQLRRSWYVALFNLPGVPEWAASRGRLDHHLLAGGMSEDEVATVRRDIVEYGALRGGLGWYRAIPVALPIARSLSRSTVSVPVTHVWSDDDVALGPRTAQLAQRWATGDFELVTLRGRTHWLPEQAPAELAEIIGTRIGRYQSSRATTSPSEISPVGRNPSES